MSQLYADYLYDRSNFKEAAIGECGVWPIPVRVKSISILTYLLNFIAYESLTLYEPAYQCYKQVYLWQESLYCASLVPLSESEMSDLALSLATGLTEITKDYISAAHIHSEHLKDIPSAARLLCRGTQYSDACRLLAVHKQQSLVQTIVDASIADAMSNMIELFADCTNQLNAQIPRIQELRDRRIADPLAFFGGDPTGGTEGADIPDNVSLAPTDASTMAGRSMFTRYTGSTSASKRSSRNRRREERKRARGKKGTVYEEEYLVNSVKRLVEKVNNSIGEAETLIQTMMRRSMRERAALIQKTLDDLLEKCRVSIPEVFDVAVPAKGGGFTEQNDIDDLTQELDGVLPGTMEGQQPGAKPGGAPIVKEFKKLDLLGG